MDPNSRASWLSVSSIVVTLLAAPAHQGASASASPAPELRRAGPPIPGGRDLAQRRLCLGADGRLYVLSGGRAQGFYLPAATPGGAPLYRTLAGPVAGSLAITTGSPTRTFSIDRASPTVSGFLASVHRADDLLTVPPPEAGVAAEDVGGTGPWVSLPGEAFPRHLIGFAPTLDVDGLSRNHGSLVPPSGHGWRILFSVPRFSGGDPGTGVDEQSLRGQQAGDLFRSRQTYVPVLPDGSAAFGPDEGNELEINQHELLLVPSLGPGEFTAAQLDELDAWDDVQLVDETSGALAERIYYSVKLETDPDWAMVVFTLPAGWAVGDAPPLPGLAPIYADRADLWLTSNDDIDALVVFDPDGDGDFTNGDAVLLSLRPGSTSLAPGGVYREGPAGAFGGTGSSADVFCLYKDAAGVTFLSRLATKAQLGLSVTPGELDALEVRAEPNLLDAGPGLRRSITPPRLWD
jgi:hypothetical protein